MELVTIDLAGDAVKRPGSYDVNTGSSIGDVIDLAGGLKENPYKIIMGDLMTGIAVHTLDIPITSDTTAIWCLSKKAAEFPEESSCIRCGRCLNSCPRRLMPLNLNRYVLSHNLEMFKSDNGMDCIGCGKCSYVCPANRHLTQSIQMACKILSEQEQGEQHG